MQEKTRAIVIRTIKYGDSSNIVDLFTENRGMVSFLIRQSAGNGNRRSGKKHLLFQPLTVLSIDYDFRAKASLQKLKDVALYFPFYSVLSNPLKSAVFLFLSDFLYHVLREEPANVPLFEYLVASLEWFDQCNQGYANFHLLFLMRLTRFLGFYPCVEEYHSGDYFDLQNACFTPLQPLHAAFLKPVEAARVPLMLRMSYDTMNRFLFSRQERNRFLTVLNDYYRLHIPNFPELSSIEILKEVFD